MERGGKGRRCTSQSVSQLMTDSVEKREEQKESGNGVSESKRKTEGLGERD